MTELKTITESKQTSGLQEPAASYDNAGDDRALVQAIMRLWREGCDTIDIARRLGCAEPAVANRLAQARDALARTPTQQRLFDERRARLARLSAAARPAAAPDPVRRPASHPSERPRPISWVLPRATAPVDVRNVQDATCRHFGIALADLLSHSRCARFVRPRHVAIYLVRELTQMTMAQIGKCFGDRDHSTIVLAHRKIARSLPRAPLLQEVVRAIVADSVPRSPVGSDANPQLPFP